MVSTLVLLAVGFSIPVGLAFGIVGIMYYFLTRKPGKQAPQPKSRGYKVEVQASAAQQLEKQANLQKAVQYENYAAQVERTAKGKLNERQLLEYANKLRAYAQSLKKQ